MSAFDSAWTLLKMGRRSRNNRRGQQVSNQRRFNRPMQLPPEIMETLSPETKANLENMKQSDPEAYNKYLIELSMGFRATPPNPEPSQPIQERLLSMDEDNMQFGLKNPDKQYNYFEDGSANEGY